MNNNAGCASAPFKIVAYCPSSGALLGWGSDEARVRQNAAEFEQKLLDCGIRNATIMIAAGHWETGDYERVKDEPGYILESPIARRLTERQALAA